MVPMWRMTFYAVLVSMVKRKLSMSGLQPEGGRSSRLYCTKPDDLSLETEEVQDTDLDVKV